MSAVEPQRVRIRRADSEDARSAADILLRSRHAAVPAIPPLVHTDDDVRAWFAGNLVAGAEVWLAESNTTPVAVMVLDGPWIEQLYVDPEWTDRGVGSALVDHAKTERPDHLQLWTFQTNLGAQRFYQRHGFVEVDRTDGDNEEGAPDTRYRWDGARGRRRGAGGILCSRTMKGSDTARQFVQFDPTAWPPKSPLRSMQQCPSASVPASPMGRNSQSGDPARPSVS